MRTRPGSTQEEAPHASVLHRHHGGGHPRLLRPLSSAPGRRRPAGGREPRQWPAQRARLPARARACSVRVTRRAGRAVACRRPGTPVDRVLPPHHRRGLVGGRLHQPRRHQAGRGSGRQQHRAHRTADSVRAHKPQPLRPPPRAASLTACMPPRCSAGADPNKRDHLGRLPIHLAALAGANDAAACLIKVGALARPARAGQS